jgi:pimeloyl-ACP methyl ester carboxylesterase
MPYAVSDGVRIAYDERGRTAAGAGAPALLFMTGWCSSKERWSVVAERCAATGLHVLSTEWRGHGESEPSPGDFGLEEMVSDVLAVADTAGVGQFVPCAASHAGFVAIELRRRHPDRVPKLVHVDWYVVPPPPPYRAVLEQLTTDEWPAARDRLFEIWTAGSEAPEIAGAIAVMDRHDADMWQRSGREIAAGYDRVGSPTDAWASLDPPAAVLHLYGQPADPAFLAVQQEFAASHPWFGVRKLSGVTHFAMLETPDEVAAAIESFVSS